MSDNPVADYRDAMKDYEERKAAAVHAIRLIGDAAQQLSAHPAAFMVATYQLPLNLPPYERATTSDRRIDMRGWPDAETLRSLMTEWHGAFIQLHGAWTQVAHEDRLIVKPPPDLMTLA